MDVLVKIIKNGISSEIPWQWTHTPFDTDRRQKLKTNIFSLKIRHVKLDDLSRYVFKKEVSNRVFLTQTRYFSITIGHKNFESRKYKLSHLFFNLTPTFCFDIWQFDIIDIKCHDIKSKLTSGSFKSSK